MLGWDEGNRTSAFPAPTCASTGDKWQALNNTGALTVNAVDQDWSQRKFQACWKGILCKTIQKNCYGDQGICKICRNNMEQGKEIRADSNEAVVSEGAYLPIVGDIEVISHCWVLCCQGVNLYRKSKGHCDLASARSLLLIQNISGCFLLPPSHCCFTPIISPFLRRRWPELSCVVNTAYAWPCPNPAVHSTQPSTISF